MDNQMKNLTPKHLRIIINHLLDIYERDFSTSKSLNSHYGHINIEGERFKVGLIPNDDNTATIANIRIVYKGKV